MFSKSCTYALRAVLYTALEGSFDNKVGITQIANAIDVPKPFLGKLLQKLSKHEIISSAKGPKGGFYLSKESMKQSPLIIVKLMDGESIFNKCVLDLAECSDDNPCPFHEGFIPYRRKVFEHLENISIEEMALQIKAGKTVIKL